MSDSPEERPPTRLEKTLLGRLLLDTASFLDKIKSYLYLVGGVVGALIGYWKAMTPTGIAVLGGVGVAVAVVLTPLVVVLAFDTFPAWRERRDRKRLEALGVHGKVKDPGYFRLKPYEAADHKVFQRADGQHERVFEWITAASEPLLYLTGRSGTGKSSLLNAYVIPKLQRKRPAWVCVPVRSFGDPIGALVQALSREDEVWDKPPEVDGPRALLEQACAHLAPKPLLVAIDQFEEFVILHDDAGRTQMEELLRSLVAEPIDGLTVLLVVRSDYIGLLEDLDLPRIRQGENWSETAPFTEPHSRSFLRASGLDPGDDLLDAVLSEGMDLEENRGLVRPITLNLLGLILGRFSGRIPKDFRAGKLIEGYLREAVGRPELQGTAPRVLRPMITSAGTKQPRSVRELVRSTGLSKGQVRGCLLRMAEPGLVRCLDEPRGVWEISHDFVARHLDHVVARWQIALWRRWRPWLAPAFLVVWLGIGLLWPFVRYGWAVSELARHGAQVISDRGHQTVRVFLDEIDLGEALGPLKGLPQLRKLDLTDTEVADVSALATLPHLQRLDLTGTQVADVSALASLPQLRALDLSSTKVTGVSALASLPHLQRLNLTGTKVVDVSALASLPQLRSLNLTDTQVADVSALANLPKLQWLDLTGTKVADVSVLASLPQLQRLNLSRTRVADVSALASLSQLQGLNLYDTQVVDVSALASLSQLQTLNLYDTQVRDVSALASLLQLQRLNLSRTQVADVSALANLLQLRALDLSSTKVTGVGALASLPHLQRLNLTGTKVEDVSALASLPQLQRLNLSRTQVADVSALANLPKLQWLDLRGMQVEDVSTLANLPQLQTLVLTRTRVADVSALASLPQLQRLDLIGTQVADVSALANLPQLQRLNLADSQVTDVGALANLPHLWRLNLTGTKVADVSALASLPQLQTLNLADSQVADVSALANLPNLKWLNLTGTQVADVSALANLPHLRRLDLPGIPDAQVDFLNERLPDLRIYR